MLWSCVRWRAQGNPSQWSLTMDSHVYWSRKVAIVTITVSRVTVWTGHFWILVQRIEELHRDNSDKEFNSEARYRPDTLQESNGLLELE